jgi:hypothetical protein
MYINCESLSRIMKGKKELCLGHWEELQSTVIAGWNQIIDLPEGK